MYHTNFTMFDSRITNLIYYKNISHTDNYNKSGVIQINRYISITPCQQRSTLILYNIFLYQLAKCEIHTNLQQTILKYEKLPTCNEDL